jgi:hypothetical protein
MGRKHEVGRAFIEMHTVAFGVEIYEWPLLILFDFSSY